jgi:hypothetical protein
MSEEIKKFPIWKNAVELAINQFDYGSEISHEWLLDALELTQPADRITAQEYRDYQLRLLSAIESFRDAMLRDHDMMLVNVRGKGYVIATPGEQSGIAMRDMGRDLRKNLRKTGQKLKHTNVEKLSDDEAKRRSDAIGKLAALSSMTRRALAAPDSDDDGPVEV